MKYVVGNSIIQDREAAIEWWATACGTQDAGDPAEWDEGEVSFCLPGWCRAKIDPEEGLNEEIEQERLDQEVIERALEMIHAARMAKRPKPTFFLVREGIVSPASPDTPWDGKRSVLVFASSPKAALKIAEAYDKGKVQADNVFLEWKGCCCRIYV